MKTSKEIGEELYKVLSSGTFQDWYTDIFSPHIEEGSPEDLKKANALEVKTKDEIISDILKFLK